MIEGIIQDYYDGMFASTGSSSATCNKVLCQRGANSGSPSENEALLRQFDKAEIYAPIFEMHPCKAPGPDGVHAIFYQKIWHIVGDDV